MSFIFYEGKPTAIIPFFGDQPFWGTMVAKAGAGPKPISHKNLTIENLTEAIEFCLTPRAQLAARKMGADIRGEVSPPSLRIFFVLMSSSIEWRGGGKGFILQTFTFAGSCLL